MVLAAVARYLARELAYGPDEEEVLLFGLRLLANQVSALALTVLMGLLVGAAGPTVLAFLVGGSIKVFAGGAHARSSRNCVLLGATYFGLAGWAAGRFGPDAGLAVAAALGLAAALAALAAVWAWAPQEPAGKPLTSPGHRRAMRRASFLALVAWLAALTLLAIHGWGPAAAGPGSWRALYLGGLAGLAWQALNLSPAGHRLVGLADRILDEKGGSEGDVEKENRRRRRLRRPDGRDAERQHDLFLEYVPASAAGVAAAAEGMRPRGGVDRTARGRPGEPG